MRASRAAPAETREREVRDELRAPCRDPGGRGGDRHAEPARQGERHRHGDVARAARRNAVAGRDARGAGRHLCGAGRQFTAGIDLALLGAIRAEIADACEGRAREKLRALILDLQDTLNAIERCRKPVIAAIHGACIGGGVDLVTACDFRLASADAVFSVKEIDVGMTADLGTLQRLPRLVGEGMARELAYTGRGVDGREASAIRLVNRCFDTRDALAGRRARARRGDRGEVAARGAGREGNDHLCARPFGGRRAQLRRHVERRAAPLRRSLGGAPRRAREARAALSRLSAAGGTGPAVRPATGDRPAPV